MEQRFGKRVVQKAVEESFSRDWLTENCKCCPRCGTNIQVDPAPPYCRTVASSLPTGASVYFNVKQTVQSLMH